MALADKTQDKIYRRKRGFPSQREFPISAQKKKRQFNIGAGVAWHQVRLDRAWPPIQTI
jgi:hypothetical protein